jgi:site-specific recombinase XerD
MPPTPLPALDDRYAEILEGYASCLDATPGTNEITDAATRRTVARYLRWLQTEHFDADPLDDPHTRDIAVGFYKRSLFAVPCQPRVINQILAALRGFYTWWGTGPHQVPSLDLRPPQ